MSELKNTPDFTRCIMGSRSGVKFTALSNICALLGIPETILPPPIPSGKVRCSFCAAIVEVSEATFGQGPLKITTTTDHIRDVWGKVIDFEEKLKFSSAKLVACPDHCLLLAERTLRDHKTGALLRNRQGEPITTGTKTQWGESD